MYSVSAYNIKLPLFADVYKGVTDLVTRVQTLQRSFSHIVLVCELPVLPPGKKKKVGVEMLVKFTCQCCKV